MTVPADPPDAQILAEYQRRIAQGEPVPSQRRLIEAYGIGFPRARRLVEELKRRKATAALEAVQTSGDGAVAALATEVIGRIHQHAADADPVQSVQGAPGHTEGAPAGGEVPVQGAPGRTEGAPVDEAEPVHRTGEVDADPVQSVQGAPGRTKGAPEDEAEPVHRTSEADADPVQSVQGAPATGELAQQPRPANGGPSLGDHTSPGMNGRERPFRAPLGRMLAHDAVEIAAGGAEAPAVPPAPGRTEGAPEDGTEPVHRTDEVDAAPVQSVQGAPGRTEGAPGRTEGAPGRTEGAPVDEAEPVHRTGDEGGAAAPEQPVTPAGDPGAGTSGAGTGEGHQLAERGEVRAAVGGLAAAALRRMRRRVEEGPQRGERDADESGGTLRGWHVAAALVIAVPAFLAVWSGWIGLGEMTGWGERNMLPGLVADGGWATIHTSITLPIGIEAFGALSMAAWLASRNAGGTLARYAACCTVGSLTLGAFGQVSYHVLTAAGEPAPGWLVGFVAVLPVIVLGASVGLIHLAASNRKRR